ncbi:hypothetical protein AB0D97_15105 [Streptomyces roseus]
MTAPLTAVPAPRTEREGRRREPAVGLRADAAEQLDAAVRPG